MYTLLKLYTCYAGGFGAMIGAQIACDDHIWRSIPFSLRQTLERYPGLYSTATVVGYAAATPIGLPMFLVPQLLGAVRARALNPDGGSSNEKH